jgi:rare lipoprotein A
MTRKVLHWFILTGFCFVFAGCSVILLPYRVTKGTVKGTLWAVKTTYQVAAGTTRAVYKIGEYTFEVVRAPVEWSLTSEEIETIDGLPAKEAIRLGRVKTAPYTVKGKTYYPMSVRKAKSYKESGLASWYGFETLGRAGGHMTANGEAFNPNGLTAAHKYLPLPTYARVTSLENGASIIVRVNDRGPFPARNNPKSGNRIIDLSMGAAKRLGFYKKGTGLVRVESIQVQEK